MDYRQNSIPQVFAEPQKGVYVSYGKQLDITPHASELTFTHMAMMGIFNPIAYVDKTHGKTVCQDCGAVYVGCETECSALTWKFKYESGYNSYTEYGNLMKGERIQSKDSWGDRTWRTAKSGSELQECGSRKLKWDHEEQFRALSDLCSKVETLAPYMDADYATFSGSLVRPSPHMEVELENRKLRATVAAQGAQLAALQVAMQEVANRMNAAGQNLSFGRY